MWSHSLSCIWCCLITRALCRVWYVLSGFLVHLATLWQGQAFPITGYIYIIGTSTVSYFTDYCQTSNISRTLVGNTIVGHADVAPVQLHLHSRLNTWHQWIGQRQLQVSGFGATYIRCLTVVLKSLTNEIVHRTNASERPLFVLIATKLFKLVF